MQEASTPPGSGVAEDEEWFESFEAAARRSLAQRLKYAFVRTYKPVMDDATYRSFDTMDDYRSFCDTLPEWLGYGRV
jgi:hypothetical protein